MAEYVIIHYGELGIKGKNRPWFEKLLLENIKTQIKGLSYKDLRRISGRLLIELTKDSQKDEFERRLKRIFGMSYFCFAVNVKQDLESMKKTISDFIETEPYRSMQTVRILTKRSNKAFPLQSPDINKQLGEHLIKNHRRTIDLVDAELSIWIEIVEGYCLIYTKQIPGLKGLPVGVSGKVLALISGGIDSPVAAWYAMKRGCAVKFVHFYNETINNQAALEKVKDLVKVLSTSNKNTKLYLIPFKNIQFEIIKYVPQKYRMILYKRFMFKIAERIARKEDAKALVVGDSIGQVSSQTLDNLTVIREAAKMLVVSPLIGSDKQDIVNKAIEIGTYDISKLPYGDCCSFMIAKHPELRPESTIVKKLESHLAEEKLIDEAVKESETITF